MKPKSSAGRARTPRRRATSAALLLLAAATCWGQPASPAHWTLQLPPQAAPGSTVTARLVLTLDEPWHMYSLTTPPPGPDGGPTPTTLNVTAEGLKSFQAYLPPSVRKFDPNFELDTETYEGAQTFFLKLDLAADAKPGPLEITAALRYQLCNDKQCLPPKKVTAAATLQLAAGAAAPELAIPAGYTRLGDAPAPAAAPASSRQPVKVQGEQQQDLGAFLLVAFGFGLAAIFTPCVFPMIPITMSFFLGQSGQQKKRGEALTQALIYCVGIVVMFTAIGFGLSAALGPFAVVQLGSNVWVNGFICLVFFVFSLSLLGAFEITLPVGLLTKLNSASDGGGTIGTLLMGLTFCLTSFACVGPFMGTLLAASVGADKLRPALGMLVFSSALALPFFLLALFPSFLQKLPRSGGWMARVKIVLGFLVLAALFKYLGNIDQVLQLGLLTRERFLAAWIVLFALPGVYLLGGLRLEGVRKDEELKAGRLLTAAAFLIFSISLVPGLFGARLGELEAYIPAPAETAGATKSESGLAWKKNDFDAALAQAKAENKRVLVAFTGYACTNCHWMKANMFTKAEVAAAMKEFVLVELYTDGTDAASEANQKRQEQLFQTVAIPYYAVFNAEGQAVASLAGLTKEPAAFLNFLAEGRK